MICRALLPTRRLPSNWRRPKESPASLSARSDGVRSSTSSRTRLICKTSWRAVCSRRALRKREPVCRRNCANCWRFRHDRAAVPCRCHALRQATDRPLFLHGAGGTLLRLNGLQHMYADRGGEASLFAACKVDPANKLIDRGFFGAGEFLQRLPEGAFKRE